MPRANDQFNCFLTCLSCWRRMHQQRMQKKIWGMKEEIRFASFEFLQFTDFWRKVGRSHYDIEGVLACVRATRYDVFFVTSRCFCPIVISFFFFHSSFSSSGWKASRSSLYNAKRTWPNEDGLKSIGWYYESIAKRAYQIINFYIYIWLM